MSEDEEPPVETEEPPVEAARAPAPTAELLDFVDRRIIEDIDARAERSGTHHWTVPINLREPRLHVMPEDWGAGQLFEVRERENFPPQMMADLKHLTPQASLRDLYRPVRQDLWVEREPRAEDLDPGGRRSLAEARVARRLEPLPRIPPLVREVVAEQKRRRALMAERWQPVKRDDEERTAIDVSGDPLSDDL